MFYCSAVGLSFRLLFPMLKAMLWLVLLNPLLPSVAAALEVLSLSLWGLENKHSMSAALAASARNEGAQTVPISQTVLQKLVDLGISNRVWILRATHAPEGRCGSTAGPNTGGELPLSFHGPWWKQQKGPGQSKSWRNDASFLTARGNCLEWGASLPCLPARKAHCPSHNNVPAAGCMFNREKKGMACFCQENTQDVHHTHLALCWAESSSAGTDVKERHQENSRTEGNLAEESFCKWQ